MNEQVQQHKPKLKELRENESYMKVLYAQYMNSDKNLDDIATILNDTSGEAITGKTVGNDFKALGWELKEPRRKLKQIPTVRTSQDDLFLLQKLDIYYRFKQLNSTMGFSSKFVPPDVMGEVEKIAFGDLDLQKYREQDEIIKEKEKEITLLKAEIQKLQGRLNTLTDTFEAIKSGK